MACLLFLSFFIISQFSGGSGEVIIVESQATLADAVANYTKPNGSLEILISTTHLEVDSVVTFQELNYTLMQGVDTVTTIKCSSERAGFIFTRTRHVELKLLSFVGCAAIKEYLYNGNRSVLFSSALHIVFTQSVYISNISILESRGTGMLLAYNSRCTEVYHSNFTGNRLLDEQQKQRKAIGGGGVYLYIQNTLKESRFYFENCVFKNNTAENTDNYTYIFADKFGEAITGRGRGGGVFINIDTNVHKNTVTLSHCVITENFGHIGSGLSAEVEGEETSHNSIVVEYSNITHNGCRGDKRIGSGGGAQISYRTQPTNTNNRVVFRHVEFRANCGQIGGGTYFYSTDNTITNTNNQLLFDQCRWEDNNGHTGSAVGILPGIFDRIDGHGYSITIPVFRDCVFTQNSISGQTSSDVHETQTYGTGTLYSSLYDVKFESSVRFSNNNGSAVYIVNAIVDFSESSAVFEGNRGIQGGAVGIIGTSTMLVGPHDYRFTGNRAIDRGGAIYSYLVDSHDFLLSRSCFLQYSESGMTRGIPSSEWKARITFSGNTARSTIGNDIFTSSLLPCQTIRRNGASSHDYELLELREIFQPPGAVFLGNGTGYSIATDSAYFTNTSGYRSVVPGERFIHGVHVVDDLNQTINSMFTASFPSQDTQIEVSNSSSCLTNQVIQLIGRPHESDSLLLQVIGSHTIFTSLGVELLDCPPGFNLKDKVCECDADSYTGLLGCDAEHLHSYRRVGYWVGYANTSAGEELVATICPWGFCKLPRHTSSSENGHSEIGLLLPRLRENTEEEVCSNGRSGILCGVCNPGHTVLFHSPSYNCSREADSRCELGWFYYLSSEILPATILFVVILVFNISFTSGALNGFILFSQLLDTLLIDASGVINLPNDVKKALHVVKVIYGFFNLDFFHIESLSYCIWTDATVLGIVAFKSLTIGYSMCLIVVVLLFLRHCGGKCLGKYCRATVMRNSVIQGISAFLVLCYSQCIKISFTLLYHANLFVRPDSNTHLPRRVWYSGNMEFFSAQHLPYALPALAVLLTIGIIPPLILLTYPAIFHILACLKLRGSCVDKCLPSFSTMKPFLDAFQGSFKDNVRFFAGLYFIYRWVGLLANSVIAHYSLFYAVVEVLLLLILLLHAVFQPYQKTWHNILDALLLADLAIINKFTATHYYATRVDAGISYQNNINRSSIVQVILIYLPVLYLAGYMLFQITRSTFCKLTGSIKTKTKHMSEDSSVMLIPSSEEER